MISNEHLRDIERVFDAQVLDELFQQYAAGGHAPSIKVREALGRVYGKTTAEIEAEFDDFRTSKMIFAPPS